MIPTNNRVNRWNAVKDKLFIMGYTLDGRRWKYFDKSEKEFWLTIGKIHQDRDNIAIIWNEFSEARSLEFERSIRMWMRLNKIPRELEMNMFETLWPIEFLYFFTELKKIFNIKYGELKII